jgi:hypothetical protein
LIAKVISDAQVDTVVHASMSAHPRSAGWRTAIKELNVISTMQLLADCQRSTTVRRLVVKSTGAVYGLSLEIRLSAPSEMNRTRSRPLVTPRRPRESRATSAVSSGSARIGRHDTALYQRHRPAHPDRANALFRVAESCLPPWVTTGGFSWCMRRTRWRCLADQIRETIQQPCTACSSSATTPSSAKPACRALVPRVSRCRDREHWVDLSR